MTRSERTNLDMWAQLCARNSCLWVVSGEERRVEKAILNGVKGHRFTPVFWDCATGLLDHKREVIGPDLGNPSAILDHIGSNPERRLYVLRDFHRHLENDPFVVRQLRNLCLTLPDTPLNEARAIVIITPEGEPPPQIAAHAVQIEYPLPERPEIGAILDAACASRPEVAATLINGHRERAIDAAIGLRAQDIESAYALSLVTTGGIDPERIAAEKKRTVGRLLSWIEPDPRGLDAVGGLELYKAWIGQRKTALTQGARAYGLPAPKGVLTVGVPGCIHGDTPLTDPVTGRTRIAKNRHENGRPFYVWALGENGPVVTAAFPVQKYENQGFIEIILENGDCIMVTPEHRFLSDSGWITAGEVCGKLSKCVPCLLATTLGTDLEALLPNALRLLNTSEDSLADCLRGYRSGDGPLQIGAMDALGLAQLLGDAPERSHKQPMDDPGNGPSHTRSYQGAGRQPMPSSFHQSTGRNETLRRESARDEDGEHQTPLTETFQGLEQFGSVSSLPGIAPRLGFADRLSMLAASFSCTKYTRVRSARKRESGPYYDFHVPGFNNYWACGMWHHNCGKSLMARAVATAWRLPLLRLDFGALKSKFVGDSEGQIRKAFGVAEAVAPCVLWIDEIEKGLAGAQGGNDAGVSADQLGAFLSWMQDRTAPVFVIATANDVSALPPELLRKGRFDDLFFVDLPTQTERVAILDATLHQFKRTLPAADLDAVARATDGFSGAEIAALVPDALFAAFGDGARELTAADLLTAARAVCPLSKTAAERLAALRQWAKGRARPASLVEQQAQHAARDLDLGD